MKEFIDFVSVIYKHPGGEYVKLINICLFQKLRKKKMSFEHIADAIDSALAEWAESDDDSKVYFGDLVESGGGSSS